MLASSLSDYYFTKKNDQNCQISLLPRPFYIYEPHLLWVVKENSFSWCSTLFFNQPSCFNIDISLSFATFPTEEGEWKNAAYWCTVVWFTINVVLILFFIWFPQIHYFGGKKKRFIVVTFVFQIGGNLCFETVIYFWFSVQSGIMFFRIVICHFAAVCC